MSGRAAASWTRELVSRLADERSFARGVAYAFDGRVEGLDASGGALTATVRGARPYRVRLSGTESKRSWSCDCPVGEDGTFCKHCVAVALVSAGAAAGVERAESPRAEVDSVGAVVS
jgi:uncharacterized Zn finger protein